jgi:hypothetical protein
MKTTDETTSHLTKLQKMQQIIGYSHSTKPSKKRLASRWLSLHEVNDKTT